MVLPEDNFKQRVLQVIHGVPYGKVITYGDVAKLAGSPRAARQVGGILKKLPSNSHLPWYRVINRHGKISLIGDDYQRQYEHLRQEGVSFNKDDSIDLKRFGWLLSE